MKHYGSDRIKKKKNVKKKKFRHVPVRRTDSGKSQFQGQSTPSLEENQNSEWRSHEGTTARWSHRKTTCLERRRRRRTRSNIPAGPRGRRLTFCSAWTPSSLFFFLLALALSKKSWHPSWNLKQPAHPSSWLWKTRSIPAPHHISPYFSPPRGAGQPARWRLPWLLTPPHPLPPPFSFFFSEGARFWEAGRMFAIETKDVSAVLAEYLLGIPRLAGWRSRDLFPG